jgi:uncharacterized membrane protein
MNPQSWNEIHPLIVHFPIALLLIAPVFVLLGALLPGTRGRTFLSAALLLMSAGALGTTLARLTGNLHPSSELETKAREVLENHAEMSDLTSILFLVLTIAFAVTLWTIWYRQLKHSRVLQRTLPLMFLVFYSTGVVLLLRTAELGMRLTHEFGAQLHGQAKTRMATTRTDPGPSSQ